MDDAPTLDVDPVDESANDEHSRQRRTAHPRSKSGIEWTDARVAWVVVAAVVVGILAGVGLFRDDPDQVVLDLQEQLRQRDRSIAEMGGRIALLESELNRISPGAVERARREQELAEREAAVARRERELEGLWTVPKPRIPEDVGQFFGRLTEGFDQEAGGEDPLDRATRPSW